MNVTLITLQRAARLCACIVPGAAALTCNSPGATPDHFPPPRPVASEDTALPDATASRPPLLDGDRPRARDLGITIGRYPAGPLNAITDVAGVKVGHTTLISGTGKLDPGNGPVRTGVTAILPHGDDLWHEKVPAAGFVMNGNGEMTGLAWVNEQGALEVPILLTNTMNIPRVSDAAITWMLLKYPYIGVDDGVVLPLVAECDDSSLNDARGRHVGEADVLAALNGATGGPVPEGSVGAGTGMISYEFKGGIGTASRVLSSGDGGNTIGVLVNANHGRRRELVIAGVPVGEEITEAVVPATERSIVVVVATDAPLDSRQLGRLARRAELGVTRTGTAVHHTSGDFVLAFSTAQRVPDYPDDLTREMTVLADDYIDPLFEAVVEATEEAVVNALLRATTIKGRDGNTATAIPIAALKAAFQKYGRPLP
jgi:D-aminopeptidase